MLPSKEGEDILGEKPVAYNTAGEPIFPSEKSIHRVYDKIKEERGLSLVPKPQFGKQSTLGRFRRGRRRHPIDYSNAMWGIGRGRSNW